MKAIVKNRSDICHERYQGSPNSSLNRGTVDVELTSDDYRRSPLVQGGLEINCKVTVKVPNATARQVTERYRALVEELYVEPKEEEIFGSFILVNDSEYTWIKILVYIKGALNQGTTKQAK